MSEPFFDFLDTHIDRHVSSCGGAPISEMRVRPKPEWKDDANMVPSGLVVGIEHWGGGRVFYVEGDRRAFVESVFDVEVAETATLPVLL